MEPPNHYLNNVIMRFITYIMFFLFSITYSQTGNIGINTTNPIQQLHLGGTTATMRVESANSFNSSCA